MFNLLLGPIMSFLLTSIIWFLLGGLLSQGNMKVAILAGAVGGLYSLVRIPREY